MKPLSLFILTFALVAGCSETNLDDLGDSELDEIENQIEEDAKSLTEAADEAVKLLEEEVQSELDADGIGAIADTAPTEGIEDSEKP